MPWDSVVVCETLLNVNKRTSRHIILEHACIRLGTGMFQILAKVSAR